VGRAHALAWHRSRGGWVGPVQLPGAWVGAWDPAAGSWGGGSESFGPIHVSGTVGVGRGAAGACRPLAAGSGPVRWRRWGGGCRRGRWGGVAVNRPSGPRASRQPPSCTVRWWAWHSRVRLARSVGPPSSQWTRWWPSHQARGRSQSGGRHSRCRGWPGRCVGWGDDPAGPGPGPGLAGAPPRTGSSRVRAARSRSASPASPSGSPGAVARWAPWQARGGRGVAVAAGVVAVVVVGVVGWRLTRTRVRAPSQASRRQASGGQGRHAAGLAAEGVGWPRRLSSSTITLSWGRTRRSGGAGRLQGPPGQLDQGIGAALVAAVVIVAAGAGQGPGGQQAWPASAPPWRATMPSRVGASHTRRRPWRRSSSRSAP
jgi:hypothetical protein